VERAKVLELFSRYDAYLEGHFLLTSGLHSPHYFQCARVLQYPGPAEKLGAALAARLGVAGRATTVLSPAMGGLIIGHELGRALGCRAIFAERQDGAMRLRRFNIAPGEKVVAVEDVVTTGGSLEETVKLALEAGAEVIARCCLVDRSDRNSPPVPGLVSLVKVDVVNYNPADCPLCKEGKPLVKPGSRTPGKA